MSAQQYQPLTDVVVLDKEIHSDERLVRIEREVIWEGRIFDLTSWEVVPTIGDVGALGGPASRILGGEHFCRDTISLEIFQTNLVSNVLE
jgi:hypothetical protein